MNDTEIMERVKKVISEVLGIDKDKIEVTDRFVEDLGAESVQSLELVAAFEEEFGIEMDEEKALEVKTVKDAVEFIKKYL
ncbi:MAG: acyl carrier protein [Candidatus Omnitrophica bacterium]|nr:acyl carrier protein [Candidatus Omnitrophota bacterium]MCM8809159.1 acyl carrier protein [Candidatus Omnitrophota bacterium]MCM8811413.1 acyl carrier protein [Candidatus Omnitrophota bacterium]